MPTITFTLSAQDLTRTVDALSTRWGYNPLLPNGATNPQSKGEFVRMALARRIRDEVRAQELFVAQAAIVITDVTVT